MTKRCKRQSSQIETGGFPDEKLTFMPVKPLSSLRRSPAHGDIGA
jgi:hypothetical protein